MIELIDRILECCEKDMNSGEYIEASKLLKNIYDYSKFIPVHQTEYDKKEECRQILFSLLNKNLCFIYGVNGELRKKMINFMMDIIPPKSYATNERKNTLQRHIRFIDSVIKSYFNNFST